MNSYIYTAIGHDLKIFFLSVNFFDPLLICEFLKFHSAVMSNFIPLWVENIVCMISVLLDWLWLVLWPSLCLSW